MPEETPKKLKSSLKSSNKVLPPEDVLQTRTVGRFDDPSSVSSAEQTCNLENFWRAIFCFGGPPLPDDDLPRTFKEFKTEESQRVNSFTLASSRSEEIELDVIKRTPKKADDPETIAKKQKDMEELKSLLSHNTQEKMKGQLDEDLLEAQKHRAEEEERKVARKQQLHEIKQANIRSAEGTPRLGPNLQSPRIAPSPRVFIPPSAAASPAHTGIVSAGIASGSGSVPTTPRKMDPSELFLTPTESPSLRMDLAKSNSGTGELRSTLSKSNSGTADLRTTLSKSNSGTADLRATFSKSNSGTGSIPLGSASGSTRSVPHAPYRKTVALGQFAQLSPANTGDHVDLSDLTNFTRFACTDGISCQFYLPSREGDAKAKPARFHCDQHSTKFRLDILAITTAPTSPMQPGVETVIKSLTFDVSRDILALTKGRGPVVRIPESVPDDVLLHITLLNKPEMNLSFHDVKSRNVVYNGLPNLLSISAANAKKQQHHDHHNGANHLMELSMSVVKVTSFYWVEVPLKTVYASKFTTKLLVTLSDNTLELYNVAKEYETATNSTTPANARGAPNSARGIPGSGRMTDVDLRRSTVNDQLTLYTQSLWNPFALPEGFDIMLTIAFSTIKKVSHVGENEQDHVIEIFYQPENRDETEIRVKVDAIEKRKALIVFLEEKRKSSKKTVHHNHGLL